MTKKAQQGKSKKAAKSGSRVRPYGTPPTADPDVERTFGALQPIDQGHFQSIGDDILPWALPPLFGLRPFGINDEGKTVKGIPDSLVGAAPDTCRAAVQYTTQRTQQDKKLEDDFDEARKKCPKATLIVLCTNRSLHNVDLSTVETKAQAAQVTLEIVDGRRLACYLNERQDLRFEHLGIPIGAHTLPSLVARGRTVLPGPIQRALGQEALDRLIPRARASQTLSDRFNRPPGTTLVVAPAGMGKSTWSAAEATRYAAGRFVVWVSAKKLPLADADPIGIHVVHTAYGVADPARLQELGELFQRTRGQVCVFIDGIDESHDFAELERAIQVFRTSVLSSFAHLVLICRQEGVAELENAFTSLLSEVTHETDARVSLDELSDDEAALLLTKHGASGAETRELISSMPRAFRGIPLFLVSALRAHRSGNLVLGPDTDVIAVFAQHCIREISQRMKQRGAGPSTIVVEDFVKRLAAVAFERPQQNVPLEIVAGIPGGEEMGENSLTSRAVQAGLLLASEDDVNFAHPLYLEYFAARALEGDPAAWRGRTPTLQTASGRRVVSRLAGRLSDPEALVRALLPIDGVAACEAAIKASKPLSVDLMGALLKTLAGLLESRFPSDRRRALRLLAGLRSRHAIESLVAWWNKAARRDRLPLLGAAADAFLTLQLPEAASVVLNHYQLRHPSSFPWYEPSFVRRLENLSAAFAQALRDAAFATRRPNELPTAALMLLAILRDDRLAPWLAEQVSARALDISEHRALIHLNTEQSIAVFVQSVDRHFAARRELEGKEGESKSSAHDDAVVSTANDIAMYPHDQLTEVIRAALESSNIDHVWFGMRWADMLPDPSLVAGYAAARLRYSNYIMSLSADMIERLLKQLPFPRILETFRTLNVEAQKQVVHLMYEASDSRAESFLVGLLDDEEFRFDALQSLGLIRAFGAAPSVARFANDPNEHVRSMCFTTLGRLRYAPALRELITQLETITKKNGPSPRSTADSNLEYCLVGAIAKIGGNDAIAALVANIGKLEHPEQAVLGLLYHEAIPELRQLVDAGIVTPQVLVSSLARKRLRATTRRVRPWIQDDVLLAAVLSLAREHFAERRPHIAPSPYFAVAEFDMIPATEFLIEVAQSGEDAVEEARMLLASNGIEPYTTKALETEIDRVAQRDYFWEDEVQRFLRWPSVAVRTALLRRLENNDAGSSILSAFEWFALPSDRGIFERYEQDSRIDVADVAHQYLQGI